MPSERRPMANVQKVNGIHWSRVHARGRVTFPAAIRRHLRITPGDGLSWDLQADGSIYLRVVPKLWAKGAKKAKALRRARPKT